MIYKVLVIEDNPENMYLMCYLLGQNNYDVITAENGPDGISLAISEKPDIILLDIQLPEMDGYAVARELVKHHEVSGIPIVAVTSYAMVGDREQALAAGASGYLEKPIDPDTFISEIVRFIPGFGGSNENTSY
jgi:CheY-like chemotaxis protein